MMKIGRRGLHYMHTLNNVPKNLIEKGESRVIDASLTLIRERAKLKGELPLALGGAKASSSLLGVPLGHNSSFLQGPTFAPPRIREAIWCGSTNSTTEGASVANRQHKLLGLSVAITMMVAPVYKPSLTRQNLVKPTRRSEKS
ncbi:arginase 1, mitochondrial-like isoform X1 [Rutidosis leptorrhynchoides]|uniref:arginase 1, mitochondrial-like isoform X1 n=1 Tax=Rutidosis leptorrhynchoides TaxID=125765 RepID=UPI003A997397